MNAEPIPSRFREAREYLGFTREQVATATGWHVDRVITLEDGTGGCPTELEFANLSKLYRRPLEWFRGEFKFEPGPGITRMLEGVKDPGDREGILDFAEFLACKKQAEAAQPTAFSHFPPESGMDDQAAEDNGIVG